MIWVASSKLNQSHHFLFKLDLLPVTMMQKKIHAETSLELHHKGILFILHFRLADKKSKFTHQLAEVCKL